MPYIQHNSKVELLKDKPTEEVMKLLLGRSLKECEVKIIRDVEGEKNE